MLKRLIILLVGLLLFVGSVGADDVIRLTIKNPVQVDIAEQIVEGALTKVDNDFIVLVSPSQKDQLVTAGLTLSTIKTNVEPSLLYLIRPDGRPIQDLFEINKISPVFEIGNGLMLSEMSSLAASDVSNRKEYTTTPAEDLFVPIHYMPKTVPAAFPATLDYITDSLADLVSQDSIYAMNTRLEAFQTRYIWATDSINAARDWMVQKLIDYGYTVTTPTFYYGGDWHYNVMAVKQGYAEPDKVIVIGGHYDSITYGETPGPYEYAPGSDDDGSGTTITLEMARILKDVPTRKTIIFMPFSAEEVGLVGSRDAAQDFLNNGTDVEVMFNYDMVGFTADSYWDLNLMAGPNTAYRELTYAAALRVSAIIPQNVSLSGSSDHFSFHERGFNICYSAEGDFNTLGWHTNLDLTSRMNFPYLTEVGRMTAAALGIVANSASPTEISTILDNGDGQAITLSWDNCRIDYDYVIYYGTTSGVYTDTVAVPSGQCTYTVTGLTEGIRHYFSISGIIPDGYPAVYQVETSKRPLMFPRTPLNPKADPDLNQIALNWLDSEELDFSHYRVYRDEGMGMVLLDDNILTSDYVDNAVSAHTTYQYQVTAVDADLHESNPSPIVSAIPATFDKGVLLVDETAAGGAIPNEAEQLTFFNYLFAGTTYDKDEIDSYDDAISRNLCGQYSSLFWIDDDLGGKMIAASEDSLDWYTDYINNVFIAGFRMLSFWESSPIPTSDVLYTKFGLAAYTVNDNFDFAGATGENGFPTVEIDPANVLGNLPFTPKLFPNGSATVIYRYNSASDDPAFEGEPCGLLVDSPSGKRILLSFPLYYLTDESARSLITYVKALFGETAGAYVFGDVDNSGLFDISDLLYLVDYFFLYPPGPAPLNLAAADVDASCQMDISDLLYMVDYLYAEPPGPAPLPGCVY